MQKLHFVLQLDKDLSISCNSLNWVLQHGASNNRFYFSTLEDLCHELLNRHIFQKAMGATASRDITSLLEAISQARTAFKGDLELIQDVLIQADMARRRVGRA